MKKFLTVLLALSVVFTYSFGTVFAADPVGGTSTTLEESYTAAQAKLLATKNAVVTALASEYTQKAGAADAVEVKIAKSVYAEVAEAVYSDYMSVLQAQKAIAAKTTTAAVVFSAAAPLNDATAYGDLDGLAYSNVDTQDKFKALVLSEGDSYFTNNRYLEKTLRLAFAAFKDSVKAELNKIDLTLYSEDVISKDDPYKVTHLQKATERKAELIKNVDDQVITNDTTTAGITAAYKAVDNQKASTVIEASTTYGGVDGTVILSYKLVGVSKLKTKDELKDEAADETATIAAKKAKVASNAANYYLDATTTASKAAFKKTADAYTEVMNCRIEDAPKTDVGEKAEVGTGNWEVLTTSYAALVAKVDAYKVMVDATGRLMYDAAKLDKNLSDAKSALYSTANTVYTNDKLTANALNKAEDLQWAKDTKIAVLTDARDTLLYGNFNADKYYDIEKAKIVAKYDEVIAKVNAATSVAQVDQISTNVSVSEKIKANVVTAIKGLSKFSTEYVSLQKYVEYMNGSTKSWEDGYKTMLTQDELATFYAEKGARTSDEIVALAAEAKAKCDAIKTAKENKDAKTAVEELVKALPAQITLADKAAVQAAWTAKDDLGASIDNQAKLNNAVGQLKAAQLKAFKDAYDKLPALDKVTLTDKTAVDTLAADIKAYKETAMFDDPSYAAIDMTNYVAKVRDAAKADVVAAITALPANPTKAEVEAVRAKYDAFVKDYTGTSAPTYKAADEILNIDKLLYAEAQVKAQAADLSKLTLKAATKKVGKKIKVTLNGVAVDDSTAYVQLWKSKNAVKWSFSKRVAVTATSTYITKPYKGKTYVKFRVVTVNEDGTKNFSAWSNLGCRIVK